MKFQDWLNENTIEIMPNCGFRNYKQIICNDGFSMSVQAFDGAYCHPRGLLNDANEYTHFEVGFPTSDEITFLSYAEDESNPTETVYPYVRAFFIQQTIDMHGGIKND